MTAAGTDEFGRVEVACRVENGVYDTILFKDRATADRALAEFRAAGGDLMRSHNYGTAIHKLWLEVARKHDQQRHWQARGTARYKTLDGFDPPLKEPWEFVIGGKWPADWELERVRADMLKRQAEDNASGIAIYEIDPATVRLQAPILQAGCPWCTRITVHRDGSETTVAPGRA